MMCAQSCVPRWKRPFDYSLPFQGLGVPTCEMRRFVSQDTRTPAIRAGQQVSSVFLDGAMHNGRAPFSSEALAGPKGRYNITRIGRYVPQSDSHTKANSTGIESTVGCSSYTIGVAFTSVQSKSGYIQLCRHSVTQRTEDKEDELVKLLSSYRFESGSPRRHGHR
eukprot:3762510-Pyramimonas_sp.AAC.1